MEANKLPKTLRKYASKIEDYSDEKASDNGVWVYYVPGWKSSTDPVGNQHQEHEDTVKECASWVKSALPCNCQECLDMIAATDGVCNGKGN